MMEEPPSDPLLVRRYLIVVCCETLACQQWWVQVARHSDADILYIFVTGKLTGLVLCMSRDYRTLVKILSRGNAM